MPNKIVESRPTTFSELLGEIEEFQSKSEISWYRGCRSITHQLKPTLYRHATKTKIEDIAVLENDLTTRFVQRSLPFLQRTFTDEWDKLFFMQHYGVPTRLLDWSENPFVSIYFALLPDEKFKKSDACLWMCNPIAWNQASLSHISFKGGVLDQSSTVLRAYAPGTAVADLLMSPITVYGSYNSPRIVAQRGGFVLFGKGTTPMEQLFKSDDKYPSDCLKKIVISYDKIDEIRTSLFRKGFTESVVFPDLDGLAKELRRMFDF
jgi:hypothetical protein